MVRRTNAYDPLDATAAPHWHVVRTMHGSVVESHQLAPGDDLKRCLIKWIDAGWKIGEFTSTSGAFFYTSLANLQGSCVETNRERDGTWRDASYASGAVAKVSSSGVSTDWPAGAFDAAAAVPGGLRSAFASP